MTDRASRPPISTLVAAGRARIPATAVMRAAEERLDRAAKALGCRVDWPFMYLFFLPITSIPDYAITDVGPVDVAAMAVFDPVLGPAAK